MYQSCEWEYQENCHAKEKVYFEDCIHVFQQCRIRSKVDNALYPFCQGNHDTWIAMVRMAN